MKLSRISVPCPAGDSIQWPTYPRIHLAAPVQFKLGAFDPAIADYSAAIAENAKDAGSLCARGVAKLKKGHTAGGSDDIAAARTIKPDAAEVYARYGVKLDAATAAPAAAATSAAPSADCTSAETHWRPSRRSGPSRPMRITSSASPIARSRHLREHGSRRSCARQRVDGTQ